MNWEEREARPINAVGVRQKKLLTRAPVMPFNTMEYRLNKIAELCSEHGLQTDKPDKNQVDVKISDDYVLSFLNLVDEKDTLVGFDGTSFTLGFGRTLVSAESQRYGRLG